MNKDERHEWEKKNAANNTAYLLVDFTHFLMAILWIIGLMWLLADNPLLVAVGVMLCLTNIANFFYHGAKRITFSKDLKEWKLKVKSEIKEEIKREIY